MKGERIIGLKVVAVFFRFLSFPSISLDLTQLPSSIPRALARNPGARGNQVPTTPLRLTCPCTFLFMMKEVRRRRRRNKKKRKKKKKEGREKFKIKDPNLSLSLTTLHPWNRNQAFLFPLLPFFSFTLSLDSSFLPSLSPPLSRCTFTTGIVVEPLVYAPCLRCWLRYRDCFPK
ncbi:hypothetical protein IE53DRAFT_166866 [Violaceomyces palustris]|uniref:Uncharacterized protein n=1 Tax=Violaceomyces palustris TaxID=1673888 RepID=A0ACD0NTF4_9BASI|nr:hypothetical protein IE53DRAFT_166866 [Violaceomyces palustris]